MTHDFEGALTWLDDWWDNTDDYILPEFKVYEAIQAALQMAIDDNWQPKENFEKNGEEVIAWVSSNKGFEDVIERLIYLDTGNPLIYPDVGWYWADSEDLVKRPDLIKGVKPWPKPPTENSDE